MNRSELSVQLRNLFENQRLAVLATPMSDSPYASLVGFSHNEDLRSLVFATLKDTRKFINILSNPHVSLLIDNRSNDPSDLYEASAVTVLGVACEITEPSARSAATARFLEKHPCLDEFVHSPNCALLRVDVYQYHFVSRFQNVVMMEFSK